MKKSDSVIDLKNVTMQFKTGDSPVMTVLDTISLTLKKGEIVALLGRSGSGKSTLLRIMAGLIQPTYGSITWQDQPLTGPTEGISMVFQSFALFPWLSVFENVELGLESLNLTPIERRKRALKAIDLIGLDGFESAYPKELSGGMRQRVGFARALVVHPKLLLMDEPFSALDVLTAETIRTDILELWQTGELSIDTIFLVTHNIEEAVFMSNRVLILSANPGKLIEDYTINLPHPRDRLSPEFQAIVDDIYTLMTKKPRASAQKPSETQSLIRISPNRLAGLMELIAAPPYNGTADLPHLAHKFQMEVDDLFPILEMLDLLHFSKTEAGDVQLTPSGVEFVSMDTNERKQLFARHLVNYVPIAHMIYKVLEERDSHRAPFSRFSQQLEDVMSEMDAARTLKTIVDWGRYAELFAFDEQSQTFSLDDPS